MTLSDNTSLVLGEARARLARQAEDVVKVRDRALVLLTAGGLVASLFVGFADDVRGGLRGWTWAALWSFSVLALVVVFIQWPRRLIYANDPITMLDEWDLVARSPDDAAQHLARFMGKHHDKNERDVVRWLFWAFTLGCAALGAEALFFLLDLRGR